MGGRAPPGAIDLCWLPAISDWDQRLGALAEVRTLEAAWPELVALANARLSYVRTARLDRELCRLSRSATAAEMAEPLRLAVLGSSTFSHLSASLRVAALRRGLRLVVYEGAYGQYWQELQDPNSALHQFRPGAVLFAFDAEHLTRGLGAGDDAVTASALIKDRLGQLDACWSLAKDAFGCILLQQTALPVFPALLGSNEHRLPGSRHRMIGVLNAALREQADVAGVDLIAVDQRAATDGLAAWHDRPFWHHGKQEISPGAAPLYGDLVLRVIAARSGLARKCLVLDLDDTLWGGTVSEDGVEGLVLGQGSATGEAFLSVQRYASDLARRGIILAVCSKNDEAVALNAFQSLPEMLIGRSDIACFMANWRAKAENLRDIAETLRIGLDAMVFLDNDPSERRLVREALPTVAVPEISDDPATWAALLADSGYFEAVQLTEEDRQRAHLYQLLSSPGTGGASPSQSSRSLEALGFELVCRPIDAVSLARAVQLINKTNQFNLTTRRKPCDARAPPAMKISH